ncbi:ATP synthase subunit I [Picosynechococcus sp. PCC 7117]|uniref:ATP synthase subunit I n=1 Tax=Picosynechococcus sp. PCC 7117 TaxID=195498 RepID=UPI000810CBB9|nr:ATP synthase subunit I [Picosynechococcus sp. PCC 7117]ANV89002.1 ATPase F0F1 [Picosynechococcus sp. PCC 7117]
MNLFLEKITPNLFVFPLGFGLGLFYFTALWFTVKQLTRSQHPVLLIITSGVVRLILAMTALYFMIGGHWERVLIALAGFLLARTILINRWRPQTSLSELLLEE